MKSFLYLSPVPNRDPWTVLIDGEDIFDNFDDVFDEMDAFMRMHREAKANANTSHTSHDSHVSNTSHDTHAPHESHDSHASQASHDSCMSPPCVHIKAARKWWFSERPRYDTIPDELIESLCDGIPPSRFVFDFSDLFR